VLKIEERERAKGALATRGHERRPWHCGGGSHLIEPYLERKWGQRHKHKKEEGEAELRARRIGQ
jgi:hypothetical protein